MGYNYYIEARLSGWCATTQETKECKTFIEFLFYIIRFKIKYPIVDAKIRNGYKDCDNCNLADKPLCYKIRKGE